MRRCPWIAGVPLLLASNVVLAAEPAAAETVSSTSSTPTVSESPSPAVATPPEGASSGAAAETPAAAEQAPASEESSVEAASVEAEEAPVAKKKKRKTVAEVRLVNTSGSDAPPPPEPEVDPTTQPYTHHLARWEVALGGAFVAPGSSSFDLFSSRDLHGRLFVRGTRSFPLGPKFSFALAPEWNVLAVGDGNVRSVASSLLMSEFSLGLELRYHLHPRFVALVRLSPGGTHTKATLEGGTAILAHESFHFHAAAMAGMLGLLAGSANGAEPGLRLHWLVEAGFDWTPSRNLRFRPTEGSPERTQNFDWSGFDMSTPQVSAGLALSF